MANASFEDFIAQNITADILLEDDLHPPLDMTRSESFTNQIAKQSTSHSLWYRSSAHDGLDDICYFHPVIFCVCVGDLTGSRNRMAVNIYFNIWSLAVQKSC